MGSFAIEGCGIDLTKLTIRKNDLLNFLYKHAFTDKDAIDEVKMYPNQNIKFSDIINDFYMNGSITRIIFNETEVDFDLVKASNNNCYIVFCYRFPWDYNDKEITLDPDDIEEILTKYFKELGLKNKDIVVRHIECLFLD